MSTPDPERLASLRARIDTLDETLHRALIERSAIIDELIVAKGSTVDKGAVFRPGREAQMMRNLAERHEGSLPLAVIEELWHLIIASHTALQAPYRAFVDVSSDPLPAWDTARFLLGFAVPVEPCGSPDLVLDAMAEHGTALGIVPIVNRSEWWRRLGGEGPRIMSRTPIMQRPHGGAGGVTDPEGIVPHWILAPRLSDPMPFDTVVTRLIVPMDTEADVLVEGSSATVAATAEKDGHLELLVEGEAPDPLLSVTLDKIDCGGYHRTR